LSLAFFSIGLAIAKRLGLDGAKVVVSSRKRSNVDATVENLKSKDIEAFGVRCHVGHPEHRKTLVEQTLEHFGGIDILVSNAAVNPHFGLMMDVRKMFIRTCA
jgi:dehydrogenase/reductase SDR family protein 4